MDFRVCALVFLHTITLSTAIFSPVVEKCCLKGKAWFHTSKELCPTFGGALRDIQPGHRAFCRSTIDVCCLISRKKKQCNNGIVVADTRKDCNSLNNRVGLDKTRECCQCCYLGMQTALNTPSCILPSQITDISCEKAFMHCCNRSLSSSKFSPQSNSSSGPSKKNQRHLDNRGPISRPCSQCQHTCISDPVSGSTRCMCKRGYHLKADGSTCEDIDECTQTNICTSFQTCENTVGSYTCRNIQNDKPVDVFPTGRSSGGSGGSGGSGSSGSSGSSSSGSSGSGSSGGGSSGGYTGNKNNSGGYTGGSSGNGGSSGGSGSSGSSGSSGHSSGNSGGYYNDGQVTAEDIRLCGLGYKYDKVKSTCEDVNECSGNTDTCVEGQSCENTIGSYLCRRSMSCGTGYTLDQRSQLCLDEDECKLGTHFCGRAWDCVNIPGSFRCVQKECQKGYKLDLRNGRCDPIRCLPGMKPDDTGNCVDMNECLETPQVCRIDQECRNTIGSYECKKRLYCSAGYKKNADESQCEDINECESNTHDCLGHLMLCKNKPGSYVCQCQSGFLLNRERKVCEDINECREFNACAKNQRCENTHGSFRCLCKEGFQINGTGCSDIDECRRPGMCQHECVNTQGSFQCYCREGFKISPDRRTCEDINECREASQSGIQLCLGICENTLGSFECTCPSGYKLDSDKRTCNDIDECSTGIAQCQDSNSQCFNIRGGYKCQDLTCPSGFHGSSLDKQNSMKCVRRYTLCPQGDFECLYAPIYYSFSLISFPTTYTVNSNIFALRLPTNSQRRFDPVLEFIKAQHPYTGHASVDSSFFRLQTEDSRVVLELRRKIEEAQDIELQLKLNIYSKEFEFQNKEAFFGTAVVRVLLYVTHDPW